MKNKGILIVARKNKFGLIAKTSRFQENKHCCFQFHGKLVHLLKQKRTRCNSKVSGKGRGSKKSTFIWKIVWKHFWSKNRCLQILLRKICLCKLKIYLCYTFLAETAKPVEYFLVEARSSSGKLEKKTRNEKRVEFHVFWRKVYLICLLLACTNIRITSNWKNLFSKLLFSHFVTFPIVIVFE